MPKETYYERMEKEEVCKCKEPNIVNGLCIVCGGEAKKEIKQEEIKEEEPKATKKRKKKVDRCEIYWGETLYSEDEDQISIIDGFIAHGDHMLIHASKGVGKSVLAMEIMSKLTTGEQFLGTYNVNKTMNVFWLQGESTHKRYDKRILDMKKFTEINDSKRFFVKCKRLALNINNDLEILMEQLTKPKVDVDLIIFDSLYNFVKGSKNSDDVAQDWTNNVNYMLDYFDATAISLGHTGKDSFFQVPGGNAEVISKGNSAKGATEWDAAFTIIYELREIDRKKHILRLINHKDRDGECIDEMTFKMITPQKDKHGRLGLTMDMEVEEVGYNQFNIVKLLKKVGHSMTANEIQEELKLPQSSFYFSMNHCLKDGTVNKLKDEHGRVCYIKV